VAGDDVFVHETAIIEEGVTLGSGTRVWHHAHLRQGASVGEHCNLGKNVYVGAGVRIGSNTKIQNNVSVYEGVTLGNQVFVGPSAVFTNDLFPRSRPGSRWALVETAVDDGAAIGANATIVCGVRLGRWCTVAAGAVVTHDVEPHELVGGNPARRMGWMCECGRLVVRTSGPIPEADCSACGRTLPPVAR